ncbi:hypothetical protein NC652_040691 [Populus alba x Populus x berolinensis]|nr:hypothetical protein NC652_040691 [Populus alba x Populus x berolinensis]
MFPVLLPLRKQRNGDVMEYWWASCFLPPLLVVSLRGLLCFFEKKQRNESSFYSSPRFCDFFVASPLVYWVFFVWDFLASGYFFSPSLPCFLPSFPPGFVFFLPLFRPVIPCFLRLYSHSIPPLQGNQSTVIAGVMVAVGS